MNRKRMTYVIATVLVLICSVTCALLITGGYAAGLASASMPTAVPTPLPEDLPVNNSHAILTKALPAHVDGIIVKPLPKIAPVWHYNDQGDIVSIEPAIWRLVIRVNGIDDVYPVTPETFHQVWWMESVKLDCTTLPCVVE